MAGHHTHVKEDPNVENRNRLYHVKSRFSQEEVDYMNDLYDKDIRELFYYMKKRYEDIDNYVSGAVENTRHMIKVKSARTNE